LLDRDFPPRFWGGSDGRTTRIWELQLSTGALTELPSQNANCFQVHAVWTFDGEQILYHGPSASGGHFIGVCHQDGSPFREWDFSSATHYGHIAAMADRPAIILDGNVSANLLTWLYYDREQPRIEVIAAHNTQWGTILGQASHPHPFCSPDGRWISFNTAQQGRTEVIVVRV
jgi:Tol biopolymer transport system component